MDEDEVFAKRRRNESEWGRNKRKKLRAEGKAYTNSRKQATPPRKTGNKCRCKEKKCIDESHISADIKTVVLDRFNAAGDTKKQDLLLASGIKVCEIKRRRQVKENSTIRRAYQYSYAINTGTEASSVCREAYASLHGVGTSRIRRIAKDVGDGVVPQDKRGCHNNRPRAISEETKMKIDVHICQYPYEVSHYGRNRTKKRYLRPDISVRKMYVMFVEKEFPEAYKQIVEDNLQPEKIDCVVSYEYYVRYFKDNFNYGFGQPRTAVCGKCEELKVKIRCEKNRDIRNRLQTELKLHKVKAGAYYEHLRQCTEKAKQSEEHETICFDFEQNFPFPHLPVGEVFYKRQLWFYNFSVHSCKTGQPVMYTWPEQTARRGCREVISCLNHFIQTKVPHTVKHLDLFSDGCRGQNHNHTL